MKEQFHGQSSAEIQSDTDVQLLLREMVLEVQREPGYSSACVRNGSFFFSKCGTVP